ncbi:MAG: hypothetical protein AAF351_09900 [Pseudomonadota bacterium]
MRAISIALIASTSLFCTSALAAVTVENLSKAKFSGGAGAANIFAGDAAKDGINILTSIDGEIRVTKTGRQIELIDLGAEKIWTYKLSRRGKPGKCKVVTFDEQREAMAALKDLDFTGGRDPDTSVETANDAALPEYEVTINMTETGEEETHAGLTGEVIDIVVLVHRPEMTLEEGGGSRIETTLVIGPKPDGWDESVAWNQRYFEAIGIDAETFEGLGQVLASAPALKTAMDGLQDKEATFDGAVLRSKMKLYTMADPRAAEQQDSGDKGGFPSSVGDLGSKIGSSIFKRGKEELSDPGPREVFKSSTVLTSYTTEADALVMLPERCEQ